MKTIKQLLRPERLRQAPAQFSWVDQALDQQHFIDRCEARSTYASGTNVVAAPDAVAIGDVDVDGRNDIVLWADGVVW